MTIFHLISALNVGGTERQLVELLRGLDGHGWRSEVVCFRKTGGFLADVQAIGIEPRELPLHGTLARPNTFSVVRRLADWLSDGAHVLHCHDAYAAIIGVPAARLARVPVIVSRRDLAHHLTRVHRQALRTAMAFSTRVLANALTVAAQAQLEDGVPAGRLVVVPNGIDLPRFDRRAEQLAPPVPPELSRNPTVVTVGRLIHAAKGHDDLLRAIAVVQRVAPEVRFLLVGDGFREGELRQLADRLGVTPAVRFLGRRSDVPALLRAADLVCHPARSEGMPNAVLEAMAAGRPLVATTAGGTPELVRDGVEGRLVPPADPRALAQAILEVLSDPRRERYGEAGRARVERELTLPRLVERVERVYESMRA